MTSTGGLERIRYSDAFVNHTYTHTLDYILRKFK